VGDRFVHGRDEYEIINIREDIGGTYWYKTEDLRGHTGEFHASDLEQMQRRD
jgi:hypothetical protein